MDDDFALPELPADGIFAYYKDEAELRHVLRDAAAWGKVRAVVDSWTGLSGQRFSAADWREYALELSNNGVDAAANVVFAIADALDATAGSKGDRDG